MSDFDYFIDDKNKDDSIFDSLDIDFDFDYINHSSVIAQSPSNIDNQILSPNTESYNTTTSTTTAPIIFDNKDKTKSTKPTKANNSSSSSSSILIAQAFSTQQDIRKTYKKWSNSEDRCLISEIKNQLLNGHINNQTADFTESILKVSKLLQRPFEDCKIRYHAYFVASSKSRQQQNNKKAELKKKLSKNNQIINIQHNTKIESFSSNVKQNHYNPPLPEQNLIQSQSLNTVQIDEANLKFLSSTFQDPSLNKLLSALASPSVKLSMPRQKDDSTIFSSNYTSTIKHNQHQLLPKHHSSPNLLKSGHEWLKSTSTINNVVTNTSNNINNDKIIDKVVDDDMELKQIILSPTPLSKSGGKSNKNIDNKSNNLHTAIDTSEQIEIENNELSSILLSPTPIVNSKISNRINSNESIPINEALKFTKDQSDDQNNNIISNNDHIENKVNNNNTSHNSNGNINDRIIDNSDTDDLLTPVVTSSLSKSITNRNISLPPNINTCDQLDIDNNDNNELKSIILAPTPVASSSASSNFTHQIKQPEGIYNASNNNIKFTSDIVKPCIRQFLPPPVDVTQYDLDISETIMLPTPLNATPILKKSLNNNESPKIETSPSDSINPLSTTSISSSNSSLSSTYSRKFFPSSINSNNDENSNNIDVINNGLNTNTDINSIPIPIVVVGKESVSKYVNINKKSTREEFFGDTDDSNNNLAKNMKIKKSNLSKSIADNIKPIEIKSDEGTKLLSLDKICRQLIENFGCKIEMLHAIPQVNIDNNIRNSNSNNIINNQPIIQNENKDVVKVVKLDILSDNNDGKKRKCDTSRESVKDRGEYRVENIAKLLQVHTRRIYDVLKILECLTIVTKPLGDGSFSWNGLTNLIYNLGIEQQEGIKLFPLMAFTKGLIDQNEFDRIKSSTNNNEKTTDFSTQRLCKLFLQLYLVGYNDMSSSSSFSNLVIGESVDLKDQKTITKVKIIFYFYN
jgi:hypothetical protein